MLAKKLAVIDDVRVTILFPADGTASKKPRESRGFSIGFPLLRGEED
jgi:hypothetical protein